MKRNLLLTLGISANLYLTGCSNSKYTDVSLSQYFVRRELAPNEMTGYRQRAGITVADIDKDGDLDILVLTEGGGILLYENRLPANEKEPVEKSNPP